MTVDAQSSLEQGAFVDANGVRTHYHEAGDGFPVLLLHGSGPGVSAWANWRFTIPALADRFRVLAPDLLGFNKTLPREDGRYGLAPWAGHVMAFARAVGIDRAHVVGNSMGGAVALELARRDPDFVDGLALMGTMGIQIDLPPGLDEVWGYEPSQQAMRHLLKDLFAYDKSLVSDDLVELRYQASIASGRQEAFSSMFPPPRQRWVDDLSLPEEALRTIGCPTLLVHGLDDRVIPFEETTLRLLRLLPDARMHVFAQCGHWTMIEKRDEFNALVAGFLAL